MTAVMRGWMGKRVMLVLVVILLIAVLTAFLSPLQCASDTLVRRGFVQDSKTKQSYSYDQNIPLIFVGGMPRSGKSSITNFRSPFTCIVKISDDSFDIGSTKKVLT